MVDEVGAIVGAVEEEFDDGKVCEREGLGDNLLDADLDGPRSAATCDERDTNFLNSYLSARVHDKARLQTSRLDSHRMYFSRSLSRSESIMFVGGGCLVSSGL